MKMYINDLTHFRFLTEQQLFESPVLYMCPSVSKWIGFTLWDMCNNYNFVLQTVPQNIYNYIQTSDLGILEKIIPTFNMQVLEK